MKRLAVLLVLVLCATAALAQDRVDIGPIELINTDAPEGQQAATSAAGDVPGWTDSLTPAIKLGIIMVAVGVPMLVVILGRLWRRLPESERVLILLCSAMGRGRGFRNRVKSLGGATGPAGRPITPVAMLLSPRAFDTALTSATNAERAFGQPLRHAVHGFRKG